MYNEYTNFATYNWRRNTVFIDRNIITPDVRHLHWQERFKKLDEVYGMDYHERLYRYATPEQRLEVEALISRHEGCNISEYC